MGMINATSVTDVNNLHVRGDSLRSITRPNTVWSLSSVLQFQRW